MTVSGLARRALILLGGILLAITLAAGISAQDAHAATPVRHTRINWGVNRNTWDAFHKAVPLAHSVRVYYDSTNPATWPQHWPARAAGNPCVLLSMRPEPWPLLHGKYDAYFKAFFASAPPCSLFTIWHEDAVQNDPLGYTGAVRNPAVYRAMQTYMENLVQGTHVKFGTLGCGPVNQAEEWYAPKLDWYGYDLYFNDRYLTGGGLRHGSMSPFTSTTGTLVEAKVWARMTANLAAIQKVSGERYPAIRLGESNASPDSYRRAWFTDVANWFDHYDGHRPAWIETFWRDGKSAKQGGLSGPWPPGKSVVQRLRWLTELHR